MFSPSRVVGDSVVGDKVVGDCVVGDSVVGDSVVGGAVVRRLQRAARKVFQMGFQCDSNGIPKGIPRGYKEYIREMLYYIRDSYIRNRM